MKGAGTETFVGREAELAAFERLFDSVREGQGRLLLLAGDAGIGKSRLVAEALARSGFQVFAGASAEEATPSYGPVAAVLRACLRRVPGDPAGNGPLSRFLALLLPELGAPAEATDRETLVEAVGATLAQTAAVAPCAVLLEDLHWADDATLELLPDLVRRLERERVLIVGVYRSDELPRGHRLRWMRNELRRARRLAEIQLGPLSEQEAVLLLADVLGDAPAPGLARRIYEQTQGMPFFVEELAAALADAGRLQPGAHGLELVPGDDVPVPESVRDAVLLRLDSLPEATRRAVELAAVAGTEFDLALVDALAEDDAGADALLSGNLVVEVRPGRGAFRHALVREAVLGQVLWSRRRRLNGRIAAYLEAQNAPPEQVAEHWLGAHEAERARRALLAAAERSCRMHAYRDAARAAHRALELWPEESEEEERLRTLERLAHCAQVNGQFRDAERALRELVESPAVRANARRYAEGQRLLAAVHGLQGGREQALASHREAAAAFERAGEPAEAAVELLAVTRLHMAPALYDAARESITKAVQLAAASGRADVEARVLGMQGYVLARQGDSRQGRELVQRALSLALEHRQMDAAAEVYRRLGGVLDYASDYAGAGEAYAAAVEFCREQGNDVQATLCLGCMAFVLVRSGEWSRAGELCRELVRERDSDDLSRATGLGVLGILHALRGETRSARRALRRSLDLVRKSSLSVHKMLIHWAYGMVGEQEGDTASARDHYDRMLELWKAGQDRHDAIPGLVAAVAFYAGRGLVPETNRCAEALAGIAADTGNPEAMGSLAFALGEAALLHGDAQEAVEQLQHSVAHFESLDVPLERARAMMRLGVALARTGASADGTRQLTTAYRMLRKIGARPLAARAAAELEALGEPVEDPRTAFAARQAAPVSLTRRQTEVARLIARGMTNKEIAAKLYLSARTVDMHVANLLDRLDCRSRAEAVRKAAELGVLG